MAKDFIINTSGLNSYGTRVLTPGIDLAQFKRNPVLLYMHTRGFDGKSTPIGRVENIRVEGDELRGTPVFDMKDPFAAEIGRKWEEDFIRMCSAGLEPLELSTATEHLLPGQSRATVLRSKLVEVSIADIGSNDDSLKLYEPGGKILRLASGADSEIVPLLKNAHTPVAQPAPAENNGNNQTIFSMNKILLTLGLPATATEDDAVNAITKLQGDVARIETLELARIEAAVDAAIEARKTTADKRDHLITLGKKAGFDTLQSTIAMLTPVQKPTQLINPAGGAASGASVELAYSEMSDEQLRKLEKENPEKFMQLFKAEFGYVPKIDK
ncbi:hypothetical protein [uncultured Alistipes sp.]|uniref:hypothetical protein n=1 Tax=uncultured Alistipes sp. TaxID=538949 RepID=UPI00263590AE|nr:hypothetical protein [uncultured Alistipes sp.]